MTGQSIFRTALLDASEPVPEGLLDGHGGPAGRRYSVYRNNVAVSLTEALQTGFPVLHKLLGNSTFDRLAAVYLRAHLPRSPLMMRYGEEMPEFLEGFEPLRQFGYLPDVARLELALRRSYHAADADPFDAALLDRAEPARLAEARLSFAPSVEVVPSRWPLFDIWRFTMEDGAPKPRAVPQSVLVMRPEFDPVPHPLTPAEASCLGALRAGETLTRAVVSGEAEDARFGIGPLLNVLVAGHAITDLKY